MTMKVGNTPAQTLPTVKKEEPAARPGGAQLPARSGFSGQSSFRAASSRPLVDLSGLGPTTQASTPALKALATQDVSTEPQAAAAPTEPASDPATPAGSDPAAARAQAQADVQALEQDGELTHQEIAGLIAAHADDPQYVAELMGVLKEDSLAVNVAGAFNNDELSAEDKQVIAQAVQIAVDRGTLSQDDINKVIEGLPNTENFRSALESVRAAGGDPAANLLAQVNGSPTLRASALDALNAVSAAAQANLAELDAQLARELAQYGGALTPEQQQQFVEEFKRRHPEYAAAQRAQQALGEYVQANLAQLKQDALSDPAAADRLYTALGSLAGSAQNDVVVAALQDPELAKAMQAAATRKGEDFGAKLAEPAAGTLAAELAIGAGSDPAKQQQMVEQLESLFASLQKVPEYAEKAQDALNNLGTLKQAFASFAQTGDAKALYNDLKGFMGGLGSEQASGLTKVLAGATFLLGAAMVAEGVIQGDPGELMRGLVEMGTNGAAVSYGLEYASRALPNLVSKEFARGLGTEVMEKVAGVVTAISSGIQFLDQLSDLDSNSDKVKALGHLCSALGGIAMVVPGGQALGTALSIAGTVLSAVGGWLEAREADERNDQFDAEALDIIANSLQPPVDPAVVQVLKDVGPETAARLNSEMKLTPEDWQRLASRPDIVGWLKEGGPHLVDQLSQGLGLHSLADFEQFLATVAPDGNKEFLDRLFQVLRNTEGTSPQELNQALAREWMDNTASGEAGKELPEPGQAAPDIDDPYADFLDRVLDYTL
jgi:hypothetical protein